MAQTNNDPRYFVWHQGNKFVLCQPPSGIVAHAVIEGILNTELVVSFPLFPSEHSSCQGATVLQYNVFSQKIEAAKETPDAQATKLITLANKRSEYLHKLEMLIQKYILKFSSPLDTELHSYIGDALKEVEHPLINEYSDIQNLSTVAGFNDLKMRYDSYALLKIKAFSYFEKFKREINDCYIEEEMQEVINKCRYDTYASAKI
jgi:hypothetical protein